MTQYIPKAAVVAWAKETYLCENASMIRKVCYKQLLNFLDTLEVKDVNLMIQTIIAECCDWLAINTNLSHDEIEACRNLMLTVKEEQCKAQKGE
jgi:hypothetical protein